MTLSPPRAAASAVVSSAAVLTGRSRAAAGAVATSTTTPASQGLRMVRSYTLTGPGARPTMAVMAFMYGQDDTINCIQDISAPGPGGARLCLAYKYSTHSFGAPAYLTNDGYVLKIVGQNRYIPLDKARIAALQADGTLPAPLPSYSISPLAYVWGYSLWIILLLVGVVTWSWMKRSPALFSAGGCALMGSAASAAMRAFLRLEPIQVTTPTSSRMSHSE